MKKIVWVTVALIVAFLLLRGQPFYDRAIKSGVRGFNRIWTALTTGQK